MNGVFLTVNKQFLLLTGILSVVTLGISAQAQTKQSITPKFISSEQAGQFKLESDGKPFIPQGLERSPKPNEGKRGIPKGIDNRIPMTSRKYPWSAIGRVRGTTSDEGDYHCTGTLIAENIVLTNAHCVINPETGEFSKKIEFMPNTIDGKYQDIAEVEEVFYGTDFKQQNGIPPTDWALMKINQPLGRKYGYLGWKSIPTATLVKNPNVFFFVGYSSDFPTQKYQQYFSAGTGWTASYEAGCSIVGEQQGLLLHDCATATGSSGGAIIGVIGGEPYIVALNNAERTNPRTGQGIINYAVKISTIEQGLSLSRK
ncbi:glutamyl endopeptidase [Calothrix sp. NIES-4071]|nr:glutamyl endopeptidase [Calothrix sp. NIES-4071]BAZ54394.1 glutamyl endopeptidase [Calothrix sp. NIES-4105]